MYFAQVLPLELVFFNTHGQDDGIVLGDGPPLYNYNLVQWVSFQSYPLIINNSCLSWIGVGREFLRWVRVDTSAPSGVSMLNLQPSLRAMFSIVWW